MAVDSFMQRAEPGSEDARDDGHTDPILQAEATLLTRHDVAGHRIFGAMAGAGLVTALVVLGAVPVALLQSVAREQSVRQLFPVS